MIRAVVSGLRDSGRKLVEDDGPLLAGALAFFMALSLGPLVVLVVAVASRVLEFGSVKAELLESAATLLGAENARLVQAIVERVDSEARDPRAVLASVAALIVGATTVFVRLRATLNRLWRIPRIADGRMTLRLVGERLTAMLVVLALGVLLVVSTLLTVTIASVQRWTHSLVPGELHAGLPPRVHDALHEPWRLLDWSVSLGGIALLLSAVFALLSDARVRWRDAALGAAVTTILISFGNHAFGVYVAYLSIGAAFGPGGAPFVLLAWLYASALALIFGAEVTWVRAERAGHPILPERDDHWRARWHHQRWRSGRRRGMAPSS